MWAADAPYLAACRGQRPPTPPVWFMRQAGRALPEYRARKGSVNILDALRDPALVAELTLQPVRRLGVDAAILYSDIVAPVAALGFGVEIRAGIGPVVEHPFRDEADLARLRPLVPEEDCPWQAAAVRLLADELPVPLIGFAGAPFTVASYLVEGGPSREQVRTRTLMRARPDLWAALLDRLADIALASLRSQVEAGAGAVQLFDSWAGSLSAAAYRRHVLPASRKVLEGLADLAVPRTHFGVATGELLGAMAEAGAEVVGVDWRVPLDEAAERAPGKVLQGNLDPTVLLAGPDALESEVKAVVEAGRAAPAHIFNLGHGVLPEVDPDVLARVVELVRAG
ncbi:MAG: uroporphyrinogen decarboxylase [Acidimicrobiales bacterium]